MHNIKVNFDKIIEVLKDILKEELTVQNNFKRPGVVPRFSDLEVIALSLTAESLGIDSENYLFSKLVTEYSDAFVNLMSRRQYNDRRKLLFGQTERVRKLLSARLNKLADIFAIDSMPLEICKIAREQRNKMGKESEQNSPDKGYCRIIPHEYFVSGESPKNQARFTNRSKMGGRNKLF